MLIVDEAYVDFIESGSSIDLINEQNNIKIDHCLVGEPTSHSSIGDKIKIGRRASQNIKHI